VSQLPPAEVFGDQQDHREYGEHDHREDYKYVCLRDARMGEG
jgi:hypothetical protein